MTGRRERLIRCGLLAVALAAFSSGIAVPGPQESGYWIWRALSLACAAGSLAAVLRFYQVLRMPDDGLRFFEPDPDWNPATRHLRLWTYGGFALIGILAAIGAATGYGVGGSIRWRALLISVAWPSLLAGGIGLTLSARERRRSPSPVPGKGP